MTRTHTWLSMLLIGTLSACAPTAKSAPAAANVGPAPRVRASGAPGNAAQQAMLRAHNVRRARHCAPALRWSRELAQSARRWADELARTSCSLVHSDTPAGENLAAVTSGAFSPDAIAELWYRELDDYRFARGRFSMKTGHFTQLVWRGTHTVGCAVSQCRGLDVWVCHYDPPGNVEGMFVEQVLPTSCRE